MKLVYLTAGAGGMYCGSCLHDNALAKAIAREGWDVQLVPFYTPIRTDEEDVSVDRVFFGGINVYLQQKIPLFRHIPKWIDGVLDAPWLIRRATSRAIETDARMLGDMAHSMLLGHEGRQRKEVHRVVRWLLADRPDIIVCTNLLIAGFVREFKRHSQVPVVVTLQGDDVFLDALPKPDFDRCMAQIKKNNTAVDAFIVHSYAFRDRMMEYFSLGPERFHVTPLGIDTRDFLPLMSRTLKDTSADGVRTIGYLARLAPEKGLHHLVDAFIRLKGFPEFNDVRLRIAGWLGPEQRAFADAQFARLRGAGLEGDFVYEGVVDREQKLRFLAEIDCLCVPVEHEEPKGLFVLESLAAGTPVVLPRKGAFGEMIADSGGGLLFAHGDVNEFDSRLHEVLRDASLRRKLAASGREFVLQHRNEKTMAMATVKSLQHVQAGRFTDSA